MKELSDNVIPKELYETYLSQGISYEGYVEGVGYAYLGVSAIKQPFNKAGHTITRLAKNSVLASDNTAVRGNNDINHVEEMKANAQYKEFARKKQQELHKVVEKYYEDVIKNTSKNLDPLENLKSTTAIRNEKDLLLRLINNESSYLSSGNFPQPLLYPNFRLIEEYIEIRERKVGKRPTPRPDRLTRGLTDYEKFILGRAASDPFATQLALRPEIQMCAVGLMGYWAFTHGHAFLPPLKSAFRVSLTTGSAYKAAGSVIGQSFASDDGIKDINIIGVVGDAILHPGAGALVGGFIGWKPLAPDTEKYSLVGYNKPLNYFASDAFITYGFSKIGGNGINKFQSYLHTSGERIFHNINLPIWLYFGTYLSTEKAKSNKVLEEINENFKRQHEDHRNFFKFKSSGED